MHSQITDLEPIENERVHVENVCKIRILRARPCVFNY